MMDKKTFSKEAASTVAASIADKLRRHDASLCIEDGTPGYFLIDIWRDATSGRKCHYPVSIEGCFLTFKLPIPVAVTFGRGYIRVGAFRLPVDCKERAVADLSYLQTLFVDAVEEYRTMMKQWPVEHRKEEIAEDIINMTVNEYVDAMLSRAGLEGSCYPGCGFTLVRIRKITGGFRTFTIRNDSFNEGIDGMQSWVDRYSRFITEHGGNKAASHMYHQQDSDQNTQ